MGPGTEREKTTDGGLGGMGGVSGVHGGGMEGGGWFPCRRLRWARLWLAVGWAMVLFVCYMTLSKRPPQVLPPFQLQDKVLHLVGYGGMALWFGGVLRLGRGSVRAALLLTLMGILLECMQGLGGYRAYEEADMVANALGVLLGALAAWTPAGRFLLGFEALAGLAPAPESAPASAPESAPDTAPSTAREIGAPSGPAIAEGHVSRADSPDSPSEKQAGPVS